MTTVPDVVHIRSVAIVYPVVGSVPGRKGVG